MARCGCGGACACSIVAGSNVTVSGVGSAANPYTISATLASASGCGITGNGTAVNPLRVNAGTWPYICPQTNGSVISCGADGVIRGDAPYHTYTQLQNLTRTYANLQIPLADTTLDSADFTFQNPDPCRNMMLMVWVEGDIDVSLTPGAQAETGMFSDNRWAFGTSPNASTSQISMHTQWGSLRQNAASVGPGANSTITIPMNGLRGTAGSTYTRIQWVVRSLWLPA
jgi:hypothetical protein